MHLKSISSVNLRHRLIMLLADNVISRPISHRDVINELHFSLQYTLSKGMKRKKKYFHGQILNISSKLYIFVISEKMQFLSFCTIIRCCLLEKWMKLSFFLHTIYFYTLLPIVIIKECQCHNERFKKIGFFPI